MDRERIFDILRWAIAIISVAIALAAGSRIVSWLIGDTGEGQTAWRAAIALVFFSASGGIAFTGIARRNGKTHE
jgi:hypothetical protein